jgi:hypothetical protein
MTGAEDGCDIVARSKKLGIAEQTGDGKAGATSRPAVGILFLTRRIPVR